MHLLLGLILYFIAQVPSFNLEVGRRRRRRRRREMSTTLNIDYSSIYLFI